MFKLAIATLALVFQAQAFATQKDITQLTSYNLINLVKGYNSAEIEATDVYSSAYDLPNLARVKNLSAYLENTTGVKDLTLVSPDEQNHEAQAFDLAKNLMTADPYQRGSSLRGIGHLMVPLKDLLGNPTVKIFTAWTSEERFYVTHAHLVVVDTQSKEVIVLTVGYSE